MAIKISNYEIEIEKVIPAIPERVEKIKYDYRFLLQQRDNIKKQAEDYAALRQKELDEVEGLISECEELGIKIETETEKSTSSK